MFDRWLRLLAVAALVASAASPIVAQSRPAVCNAPAKAANLNFTVRDLDGRDVRLSEFKGKVILLDFWATWCGPCKVEIPGFIDFYSRYRNRGLQVLGLAVEDQAPALKAYAQTMKMNYPILLGEGREDILEAFGPMPGLPTTILIGRDGIVCASHTGFTEKDVFERTIRALL